MSKTIPRGEDVNYLAHAYRYFSDSDFVLGTQVPDFLNMVDRKARARSKQAMLHLKSPDSFLSRVAAGVVQHHRDDQAFHGSSEFLMLQERLSAHLRSHSPDPRGMRSWFTAHIAIEMLMDGALHEQSPGILDELYSIYRRCDVQQFRQTVETLTGRSLPTLDKQYAFFLSEKFLYDYSTDAGLLYRINRILQRVGLEPFLPDQGQWVKVARSWVSNHLSTLMPTTEQVS